MAHLTRKNITTVASVAALVGTAGLVAYAAIMFSASNQLIGYVGQPTLSNLNVSSGNEKIYRGEYNSGDWSGTFGCYPVTNGGYVDLPNPCFGLAASSPLDTQAQALARNIGTRMDDAVGTQIEFLYPNLSATQKLTMGATPAIATPNVDFIRGTSLAPTGLRARKTVLGDIIHSRPYYYTDGANPTVFVGANDGMLHAFDATTGQERWAYIPSMLFANGKLAALASSGYQHDYYVDGSMSINKIAGGSKTILVGALGAGGKGLYALDISNLTAGSGLAAGQKGLWEITNTTLMGPASRTVNAAYKNLGDTYSNPAVVPTQDGADSVIVGNGYNNTGNGCAELFVIDAATGNKTAEINTGACSLTSPNGLSSPMVIDTNGDGKADRVYAGDIDGNMWVFDMSSASPAGWTASLLYATGKSITQRPTVALHPVKGYMLNFATGRVLSDGTAAVIPPSTVAAADDTADITTINSAYGLWDDLSATPIKTTQILTQTLTTSVYQPALVKVRTLSTDNKPDWTIHRGWKTDFPVAGDRVTGDGSFIDLGKFHINVTNPTIAYLPPGATASARGENWLYELDYLSGAAGTSPFLDMNNSGVVDDADRVELSVGKPNLAASGIPVAYATSNGVQSQPILIQLAYARVPLYNQNYNQTASTNPPPPGQTGVANGHYDIDLDWNKSVVAGNAYTGTNGYTFDHTHEYDKKWDTTGLNMLNPNLGDKGGRIDLGVAVAANQKYKVLLMNQSWNRALYLKVEDNIWSSKDYQTGIANASGKYVAGIPLTGDGVGALDLATVPTYVGNNSKVVLPTGVDPKTGKKIVLTVTTPITIGGLLGGVGGPRDKVGGLEFGMPWYAFTPKDWWKDKVVQTGLIPTNSGCARDVNADGTMATPKGVIGPNGERHGGAFTVQIIRDTTPNEVVILNAPGKPNLGFRVAQKCAAVATASKLPLLNTQANETVPKCPAEMKTRTNPFLEYVLAEYVVYWHHPNSICLGNTTAKQTDYNGNAVTGWTASPVLDKKPSKTVPTYDMTRDDPRDGSFNGTSTKTTTGGGGNNNGGANGSLVNLMGGRPYGAAAGTGAGGTALPGGVGSGSATASGVGTPSTVDQVGGLPIARRITWRELISQ